MVKAAYEKYQFSATINYTW